MRACRPAHMTQQQQDDSCPASGCCYSRLHARISVTTLKTGPPPAQASNKQHRTHRACGAMSCVQLQCPGESKVTQLGHEPMSSHRAGRNQHIVRVLQTGRTTQCTPKHTQQRHHLRQSGKGSIAAAAARPHQHCRQLQGICCTAGQPACQTDHLPPVSLQLSPGLRAQCCVFAAS